ncbi:ejaculatory bulb-specific protein 3-like [Pseudomyrmex gracilis]|uniref:ejaculatory bulb-specific protein 3-like n=1 Tax=Pseudomyrmex gracilis TaxID=219809 RepID=UPI000995B385|nr:ejaculatory bulb-specific protein 3-like [Pseudomyrmex gracilis]
MASLSCTVTILVTIITFTCVAAREFYDSKHDLLDIRNVLENKEERTDYYNCFIEAAPCKTDASKFFKEIFPEALTTQCKKCTPKQSEIMRTTIEWYLEHEPLNWAHLVAKIIENLRKKNTNTNQ